MMPDIFAKPAAERRVVFTITDSGDEKRGGECVARFRKLPDNAARHIAVLLLFQPPPVYSLDSQSTNVCWKIAGDSNVLDGIDETLGHVARELLIRHPLQLCR
jgi:hypothetical protein